MFSFLKATPHTDPSLGVLVRSRGHWRGTLALRHGQPVPLAIAGSRIAPDPDALALARAVPAALPAWRPAIEAAVWAHIEPYLEAIAAGDEPAPAGVAPATRTDALWPLITFTHLAAIPLDGRLAVELGLAIPWDEEHTLGARFHEGRLIELCGSVLAP
ncbi:MAG: hypothetical protein ABIS28_06290 [Caldimonas sp.]